MPIDPRKQEIFEAWADYDHAAPDEEKGSAKCKRNDQIRALLDAERSDASITFFLQCFKTDYIGWLHSNGHSKRRRF